MDLQVFVVNATSRRDDGGMTFLVKAENHRLAWQIARAVARTGQGALFRDPKTDELVKFPIDAGSLTVTRVLSAEKHRRGRPARVLVDDLLHLANERDVKIPPRICKVLNELTH